MKNEKLSSSLCFRRWSRKNFAAFASLGKVVKIGVLATTLSMISSPIAKCENKLVKDSLSSDRELELKEVTVVGSKVESLQGLTTTQQVISKRDVDRLPIISTESALRQSASIDIRERGTRGVQADLSIRGGSFDQSLIFLNGVNFTDSRTGHQNLGLPIDIEIVDKINLLQGLTTPGAITGAINLITGTSNKNYLNSEINAGQFGYQLYRFDGNYHYKNTNLFGAVSHKRSDGYIANTDFETTNAFVHLRQSANEYGIFDIQAGFQDKAFGSNGFYGIANPNQYEHTQTSLGSIGWNKKFGNFSFTSNINYKRVYDKYQWIRGTNMNFHRTDDVGASLLISYISSFGKTFMGGDMQFNHIYSNNLGNVIANPIAVPNESNVFYNKEKGRSSYNLFLKHKINYEQLQAEANITQAITPFGYEMLWGINAQYKVLSYLKLTANANHNLRMPTFFDLFYSSKVQMSNPNLGAEKSTTFDLGLEFQKGHYFASVNAFTRKINNMIDWIKDANPDSTIWHSVNYTQMTTKGLEVSAGVSFDKVVKNIKLSYSLLETDKDAGNYISKYALDYLKYKFSLSTQIELTSKLNLGVVGAYWKRNGSYTDASSVLLPYDPYLTIDAKLTWREKYYTIKVESSNITNTTYYDLGGLRQPGSWINAGVIVKL
ncbi:MAG: TonB-dependent receptor plug domain-containing protein [Bacteroidales bacterium]